MSLSLKRTRSLRIQGLSHPDHELRVTGLPFLRLREVGKVTSEVLTLLVYQADVSISYKGVADTAPQRAERAPE